MDIKVGTDLPGPKVKEALEHGTFDMQAFYRKLVFDDRKSKGAYLVDLDGNVFLDLFSNFALGALGYNHPAIRATTESEDFRSAVQNPTSTPFVTSRSWLDFVDTVSSRFAPDGMSKMFCVDGGGEGVESALKAAFIVHGRGRRSKAGLPENPAELSEDEQRKIMDNAGTDSVVVSFDGAFHGRGLGPLSATHSKLMHKADLPAFHWPTAPFPANRFPLDRYAEENAKAEAAALEDLERILDTHLDRVAAVLIEPIQSEGGDRHASAEFMRGVQRLSKAAGAALIFDEVQTGVGITGKLWAHQHFDLESPPDMVCFGKKMQLGGFFAAPRFDITEFGRMYQTRNGDRARALIARTVLETIDRDQLLSRIRSTGEVLLAGLEELAKKHPKLVEQPRGRGLIVSFDMPTVEQRNRFLDDALRRGVFATYTGTRSVRLRPHLITTPAQAEIALSVFADVLASYSA